MKIKYTYKPKEEEKFMTWEYVTGVDPFMKSYSYGNATIKVFHNPALDGPIQNTLNNAKENNTTKEE